MSVSSDQPLLANQLPISLDIPSGQSEDFLPIITLILKRIIDAVNTKEGSLYLPQEIANFVRFFTAGNSQVFRNGYRITVNFGALPNTATKSVAHGIVGIDPGGGQPSTFSFTQIYAVASNQSAAAESFIPIPWASSGGADNIQLTVDATNVNITTQSNKTAYTICYVVLEYLKN